MVEVVDCQEIDRCERSDFVRRHPKGNIFKTLEMYDLYATTSQ